MVNWQKIILCIAIILSCITCTKTVETKKNNGLSYYLIPEDELYFFESKHLFQNDLYYENDLILKISNKRYFRFFVRDSELDNFEVINSSYTLIKSNSSEFIGTQINDEWWEIKRINQQNQDAMIIKLSVLERFNEEINNNKNVIRNTIYKNLVNDGKGIINAIISLRPFKIFTHEMTGRKVSSVNDYHLTEQLVVFNRSKTINKLKITIPKNANYSLMRNILVDRFFLFLDRELFKKGLIVDDLNIIYDEKIFDFYWSTNYITSIFPDPLNIIDIKNSAWVQVFSRDVDTFLDWENLRTKFLTAIDKRYRKEILVPTLSMLKDNLIITEEEHSEISKYFELEFNKYVNLWFDKKINCSIENNDSTMMNHLLNKIETRQWIALKKNNQNYHRFAKLENGLVACDEKNNEVGIAIFKWPK